MSFALNIILWCILNNFNELIANQMRLINCSVDCIAHSDASPKY